MDFKGEENNNVVPPQIYLCTEVIYYIYSICIIYIYVTVPGEKVLVAHFFKIELLLP